MPKRRRIFEPRIDRTPPNLQKLVRLIFSDRGYLIFLVVLPFTKLTHMFTAFIARWYNGAIFGRKGVQS